MTVLKRYPAGSLTERDAIPMVDLLSSVWPDHDGSKERADLIPEMVAGRAADPAGVVYALYDEDRLVGHAVTFSRTILSDDGDLELMGLASVCTPEGSRGKGYGRTIVKAAFERVDSGVFPVALFQTNVPGFYRGLGAAEVKNTFVDRTSRQVDANPWWNDALMIYPASYAWPTGVIDMNGPGY